MCSGSMHRSLNGLVDPFSTFHLLRTYNRLVGPVDLAQYYNLALVKDPKPNALYPLPTALGKTHGQSFDSLLHGDNSGNHHILPQLQFQSDIHRPAFQSISSPNRTVSSTTCPSTPPPPSQPHSRSTPTSLLLTVDDNSSLFGADHSYLPSLRLPLPEASRMHFSSDGNHVADSLMTTPDDGEYACLMSRRQRGEKRPIPEEQKDDKYFERRKRNNEAAKKSRDARKMREDRIAFRAAVLEQENAILRTQMMALRDEVTTLRQMICATRPQLSQALGGVVGGGLVK